jgi:putative protein kinase ArgK-like GTPase of G3E family
MMSVKHNPPIILTEAILNQGTNELAEAILTHKQILTTNEELEKRRKARAQHELISAIESTLSKVVKTEMKEDLERLTDDLIQGKTNPKSAAKELMIRSINHIK